MPENAGRIRNVGVAVIAIELLTHGYFFWSYFLFVAGRVSIDGARLSPTFDPSLLTIAGGVLLILVAEVFRIGTRMREEQRLTV